MPPALLGRGGGEARYYRGSKYAIHAIPTCYVRDRVWEEELRWRGRPWGMLNAEWPHTHWCLRCFPQADPRVQDGARPRWGRGYLGGRQRRRRKVKPPRP